MTKKISILAVSVLLMLSCGHKPELEKAEKKLVEIYQKYSYEVDDSAYPFGDALTKLILSDTSTISYSFQLLVDSTDVNIITSWDGNLRFYSWVTPFGGTMFDYGNVFQYRSNGKVYTFQHTPWDYDEKNKYIKPKEGQDYGCSFVKIHTVKIGNKTYYLVENWARYDSGHGVGSINAFTIENDKLKLAKIFKNKNETLSSIHIEYCFRDWFFVTNKGEGFDWIFSFDENTNTLYVPIIKDDILFGYVTDQYLLYQLKENHLQYIGKDGGYWLHSSVRNFDHLLGIFETEKFIIRIDYLEKNNYRYVSWSKGKTMADKPDLIINNGILTDDFQYVFENKEYVYKISEKGLIVEKNGKKILKEEIL